MGPGTGNVRQASRGFKKKRSVWAENLVWQESPFINATF